MKTKLIATIAAIGLLPLVGVAQPQPNPSAAPNPPGPPPRPPGRHENVPKVPVTFLGVETSEIPSVVSEQLGLPKGFGLVVDYVVPDGPAATGGIKQNDILKMLNDQILTEPDQLAKLIRSYSEGTNVTFTLLRKGKEEKVQVKLGKREIPQGPDFGPGHHWHSHFPMGDHDFGDFRMDDLKKQMQALKERLSDEQRGMIRDAVIKARAEAMHARDEALRAGDQVRILSRDPDAIRATKIDIDKAQIVFSDDKGELRLEKIGGKKVLTAKDPQGLLLFSGPVETKEDLEKVPSDVRRRYEKLEQHDLPGVILRRDPNQDRKIDSDSDQNEDVQSIEQISAPSLPPRDQTPHRILI
jgi:PDZ domain